MRDSGFRLQSSSAMRHDKWPGYVLYVVYFNIVKSSDGVETQDFKEMLYLKAKDW